MSKRTCAFDGCNADLDALGRRPEAIYCSRSHKTMARKRRRREAAKLERREASVLPPVVEAPPIDLDQGPVYEDVGQMILDAARMDRQATADAHRARCAQERAAGEATHFHERALSALEDYTRDVGVIV